MLFLVGCLKNSVRCPHKTAPKGKKEKKGNAANAVSAPRPNSSPLREKRRRGGGASMTFFDKIGQPERSSASPNRGRREE